MATTSNLNGSSHVYVYAESIYFPDQRLSSPKLTVVFNVVRRYHCNSDSATSVPDHNSTHELDCPLHQFGSGSDDVVSALRDAFVLLAIPFRPLENLYWGKPRHLNDGDDGAFVKRLVGGEEGMFSKISEFATRMVRDRSNSGRTSLRMRVTIENRVAVPLRFIESLLRSREQEEISESGQNLAARILEHDRRTLTSSLSPTQFAWGPSQERVTESERGGVLGSRNTVEQDGRITLTSLSLTRFMSLFGQEGVTELVLRESAEMAATVGVAPAAKAAVEELEKFICEADDDACSGDVMTCTVCMDDMLSGTELTRMPCCHVFHGDCIVKWMEMSHSCPICRFELPTEINDRV
ncbi:43kDa postsynaptic protein [Trema orientale]|uniref:RING-type E3 ubiquitin transferase n=1 Tax=Trema orientale TaxID=63057 RepID=A0A2P5CST5_TREOI|nr:43kDa postsynaptic protein [Trema orientale]